MSRFEKLRRHLINDNILVRGNGRFNGKIISQKTQLARDNESKLSVQPASARPQQYTVRSLRSAVNAFLFANMEIIFDDTAVAILGAVNGDFSDPPTYPRPNTITLPLVFKAQKAPVERTEKKNSSQVWRKGIEIVIPSFATIVCTLDSRSTQVEVGTYWASV